MSRLAVTALLGSIALAAAGCGSSSHHAVQSTQTGSLSATTVTTAATTTTASKPPTTPTASAGTQTAASVATASGSSTSAAPQSAVVQQSVCPSEQGVGILANFGHRKTREAANAIVDQAQSVGFRGLVVQRRGCNDFAAVLPGLKNLRQAKILRREAATAGLHITLDCRSHLFEGGLAAVFGHRRTRHAAVALKRRAAAVGFQNLQVVQDRCSDWEVDLYGLGTSSERAAFRREASRAGFHITFEPG